MGSLVSEGTPPELGGVGLGDAEVVTMKLTVGEDGLQLSQHVAEDERQFGEVAPVDVKIRRERRVRSHTCLIDSRKNGPWEKLASS